ncbi:hypothetical protein FB45DRAFT_859291 [Roridomyces roridus]|uniref:Uncharacterized protein n=1 Tax=Roridomyces roridus TaxID=1738132 RepID=A0AAD7CJZ6_9AGAR|nr:hypothetical protein FB45DRAFT_859291 [Roridomyces roridus]
MPEKQARRHAVERGELFAAKSKMTCWLAWKPSSKSMQNNPRIVWQSRLHDIQRQMASLRTEAEQLEQAMPVGPVPPMELRVWFGRTGTCLLNADVTLRSSGDLATLEDYLFDHPSSNYLSREDRLLRLICLSDLRLGPSLLAARAPSLVDLKIGYIDQLQGVQMDVFTRLTSLSIESACRQFLEFTPNLQSLAVGCVSLDPAPIAPIITCAPSSRSCGGRQVAHFTIRLLRTPPQACIHAGDNAQSVTGFFDFMGPDLGNLENLTLRAVMRESLHQLFARMIPASPGVTQLPPILQALKSLTLVDCGYITNYDIFSLVSPLKSRTSGMTGVVTLESLRFTLDTDATDGDPDIDAVLSTLQRLRYGRILNMEYNVAGVNQFASIWELPHHLNARAQEN